MAAEESPLPQSLRGHLDIFQRKDVLDDQQDAPPWAAKSMISCRSRCVVTGTPTISHA